MPNYLRQSLQCKYTKGTQKWGWWPKKFCFWGGRNQRRLTSLPKNPRPRLSAFDIIASVHPRRIETHRHPALAVDADHAAFAAFFFEDAEDHGLGRLLEGLFFVGHAGGDVLGDGVVDEILAVAGAGDGAGGIVGLGARADDGGVADAAPALHAHATR